MAVAGYEITLNNASFNGLGDIFDVTETTLVSDAGLGDSPLIIPPPDRQSQPANEGDLRPKDGINTMRVDQNVSFIDLTAYNTLQKADMVLLSDIAVQPDFGGLAPASLQGYIAVVRPGFYPVMIATGTWDVIESQLRDCAAVVPPSWGLCVRIERLDQSPWPGDHTVFFTLNQIPDAHDIAQAIAGVQGPSASGAIETQDEGVTVNAVTTIINFVGAGVTASDAGGGTTDVNIPGGAGHTPRRDVFGAPVTAPLAPSVPLTPYALPPLSFVPVNTDSVQVFLNTAGVYTEGVHYTILGTAITWLGELLVPPIPVTAADLFDIRYDA